MYEKTIANEHRIYNITIPSSPALIIDLLSTQNRNEYNDLILGSGKNINAPYDTNPLDKNFKRIPIDGYVLSNANAWYVGTSSTGAFETIPIDERFTFPVSFWLEKSYIYAPAPIAGIIRIFFS